MSDSEEGHAIESATPDGNAMSNRDHWENIYRSKSLNELSWTQADAHLSYELITRTQPSMNDSIIDVGGGSSVLVDVLSSAGYRPLTVLDLSEAALVNSRNRLGPMAEQINWRAEDILGATFHLGEFDLWHDRAVFHFLTDAQDRQRYVTQVRQAVRPQGHVVIATFADDGPTRCSGLEVVRYTPETLHNQFGTEFRLLTSIREEHPSPWGAHQAFIYCLFRHEPST